MDTATAFEPVPIPELAEDLGLEPEEVLPYGRFAAKLDLAALERLRDAPDGRLISVTAMTPTKAGEGKTTTAISLVEALGRMGEHSLICLREPSLGPVFGIKGGGTGGGRAQVVPMERINLHFTGDIHAIGAANNLLAAMIDTHLMHGNELGLDPHSITWRRCIDMDDRALRQVVVGLGGRLNGSPRATGFDITAASEVMAIVAVSRDLGDLRRRLGEITVASTFEGEPVTAEQLRAAGAMTVILKDALKPNLVQTLEGQPALIHAGPFGNIAHANNSIIADRIAIKLADYVVTEAGFASDLGMQKFCDIVCRTGGFQPSAAVLVTTVRATKSHGGKPFNLLPNEDLDAIRKGMDNLAAHINIVKQYGLPCVVAINSFPTDTAREIALVKELAIEAGAETVVPHNGFGQGGAGAVDLANAVVAACDKPNSFKFLTPNGTPIVQQIEAIATRLYGAAGIDLQMQAQKDLAKLEKLGMSTAPVCVAKTQMSLSHDPALRNRPTGFIVPVRALLPSAGAGFVVALCGDMQRMPGLGKTPAFQNIDIDAQGRTVGLF